MNEHRDVSVIPICKKIQVGELGIWLKSSAHGPSKRNGRLIVRINDSQDCSKVVV
ncbi:hypothetical protein [Paenibacillus sp. M-152]|uniref:hypothetical protein n=1 Tax=Paenibacillus sp. M-152 TaxID=2487928 RepID=UPI0013EDBC52|nr:hypothetical protein [Paenibacillus sp. M-152]